MCPEEMQPVSLRLWLPTWIVTGTPWVLAAFFMSSRPLKKIACFNSTVFFLLCEQIPTRETPAFEEWQIIIDTLKEKLGFQDKRIGKVSLRNLWFFARIKVALKTIFYQHKPRSLETLHARLNQWAANENLGSTLFEVVVIRRDMTQKGSGHYGHTKSVPIMSFPSLFPGNMQKNWWTRLAVYTACMNLNGINGMLFLWAAKGATYRL